MKKLSVLALGTMVAGLLAVAHVSRAADVLIGAHLRDN